MNQSAGAIYGRWDTANPLGCASRCRPCRGRQAARYAGGLWRGRGQATDFVQVHRHDTRHARSSMVTP